MGNEWELLCRVLNRISRIVLYDNVSIVSYIVPYYIVFIYLYIWLVTAPNEITMMRRTVGLSLKIGLRF